MRACSRRFPTISTRRWRCARLRRSTIAATLKASAQLLGLLADLAGRAGSGARRRRRDRSPDRRARRGQEAPRLRDRRPHPRRAQGRRHHVGGRAGRHYLAAGMNAPLYTTEILRLAASLRSRAQLDREDGRAELRSPTCGSRITHRRPARRASAGSSACRSRSTPAPSARPRRRWSSGTPRPRRMTKSPKRWLALSRWLAERAGRRRRLARHRGARAGAAAQVAPRRDPAAVPRAARGDRGGAVTTPAETAQATTAILESGAIMLGAALVFVTIFRRLKLGATLGYIVAGALIGPQLLGLIERSRAAAPASPRSASRCCCSSSGSSFSRAGLWRLRKDIFGLGLAQVVLCGLALSAVALSRARHLARGGAGDRPAARPVVDRAGAADASLGQ